MKFASKTDSARGFTLIELLVVIAIIGILSSVVLASLNTARSKGTDAKIQSELRSVAVNAEIYYDNNGNRYQTGSTAVTSCTAANTLFTSTNPNVVQIIGDLTSASPAYDPVCGVDATGSAYAISHRLTSPATALYFCVDSTGKATTTATAPTGTACP
ncbi:type II secretion system GspH family protein [Candidatus Parcubacteria bacterium]|nr:type II secretion system GspH family protein [Candidatus Parcubacteria bacterium]